MVMEEAVYIPIPHYPPFKLRSSLIDQDPVIWVHLLEAYIQLCQVLLNGDTKLNVKSQQQFQLFLKVFLGETSEEATRIFSLGAINPDIRKNTTLLRAYVLHLVKQHSVVKLGLGGESLWHLVLIYVEKNATLIRRLLDGSFKSPLNDNKKLGKISLIPVLRKYLVEQISGGKFAHDNLQYVAMLLGTQTTATGSQIQSFLLTGLQSKKKVVLKDKRGNAAGTSSFAENFVTEEWIEALEKLYAGGKSVHARIVKDIMLVSILSLTLAKLAKVISLLGVSGVSTMALAPLLSAIILSDAYKKVSPGLEERLPFMRNIVKKEVEPEVNPKDMEFLVDMFPTLSERKAKSVLLANDRDVEKVTHLLLEDPLRIDSIPDYEEKPIEVSQSELEKGLERFKLLENETNETVGKKQKAASGEEIKKRTLTAALKLLYESDEDERDDTYDDQEQTSGLAFYEYDRKPKNKEKARLAVFDDEHGKSSPPVEGSPAPERPAVDINEINMFGYFKTEGPQVFDRESRKSKLRADIKNATKWSDEQIEGWFRMLQKSPKRFRLLEEQYLFHFSNKKAIPRQAGQKPPKAQPKPTPNGPSDKKTQARKEKHKAVVGNHNRKGRHSNKTRAEMAGMQ